MSNLTRRGIAYNLVESPYRFNIQYDDLNSITFVFSSSLYVDKFVQKVQENRNNINKSLSNRFGFKIENNVLCDLRLYAAVEKRGFLIYKNGEKFECLRSIILDGSNLIPTN